MGRRKSFVALANEGPMDVADAAGGPPTKVDTLKCARRPDNPRPKQLAVEELAASIREFGQIQPAIVASRKAYLAYRPAHAEAIGDAEWVVLAGNRRHAACVQAGTDEMLVHVADDRVGEIIEVGIIENIQREPLLPVREAEELQQLMERYGTTRVVGEKIGKTHVYVSQRLSLLNLVPQLQAAVDEGNLKITDARELAKLPQTKQLLVYQEGPPYKQPACPQPAPREGVVPGDPDTYTRTEIGNEVSTVAGHAATESGSAAVKMGGNEVSTEPGEDQSSLDFENGVSKSLDFADAMGGLEQHQQAGNGVSITTLASLPEPGTLVELMRRDYTPEQRDQVIQLLWS